MITDEMLSAWLDGEADEATCRAVESSVDSDPALAARLARLGRNDRLLRTAMDEVLGPTPPRLTSALMAAPSAQVIDLTEKRRARVAAWPARAAAAAAAVVFAVVGGAAFLRGPQAGDLVMQSASGPAAGPSLARILASVPSGTSRPLGPGVVRVSLSFQASDGRACREFETGGGVGSAAGVACRQGGVWRLEEWMAGGGGAASGSYRTAGGPQDPTIALALNRLGVTRILDREEEARAIAVGWKLPAVR